MRKFKIIFLGFLGIFVFITIIIFIYEFTIFLQFKNNCVESISRRNFGNYITIYFKPNLSKEKQIIIEKLKDNLLRINGITSIKYISSVDAAREFEKENQKQKEWAESKGIDIYDFGEIDSTIFKSRIEINPGDNKTEDYFRNIINVEIKNFGLEKDVQSFKISVVNKEDYIKSLIRFSSFIKLKLYSRAQDLKSYYKLSNCEVLQIAPLYGVEL